MVLDRLFMPIPNVAAFIAVCFIGVGALLRVKRNAGLENLMQLVGAGAIVLGAVMSIFARLVLLGTPAGSALCWTRGRSGRPYG